MRVGDVDRLFHSRDGVTSSFTLVVVLMNDMATRVARASAVVSRARSSEL